MSHQNKNRRHDGFFIRLCQSKPTYSFYLHVIINQARQQTRVEINNIKSSLFFKIDFIFFTY